MEEPRGGKGCAIIVAVAITCIISILGTVFFVTAKNYGEVHFSMEFTLTK